MKTKNIIGMLLLIAFVASIVTTIPIATTNAQEVTSFKNYAVIDAIPNPVGLGEDVLLRTGILRPLGSVLLGWEDVTITVTKPDNTTQTLGPFKTDSTGVTFTAFTPDEVGTYKFQTHFPEQEAPSTWRDAESGRTIVEGTVMLACESEILELVVQEEPLLAYPGHALPTEYWSRPIDPQLREWFSVSGNWVARPDNSLALYNDDAPETAHVLFANELTTGGLMGGVYGDNIASSAEGGDAYEGKFPNSVALNGILYYQRTDSRGEQAPAIIAVDLHTGEEWLFKNDTTLSFGQILYFNSYNYDGTFSYIWSTSGSTYTAYDPFTGNQQIQFINVPSGIRTFGPSGEILIYQIDYNNNWMALWNSTDSGLQGAVIGTPNYGSWGNTAHGRIIDATNPRSYSWNVTIPDDLQILSSFGAPTGRIYTDDRMVGMFYNETMVRVWAINLAGLNQDSTSVSKLFDRTWNAPAEWLDGLNTLHYVGATNEATYIDADGHEQSGVIAVWDKELQTHYGFSTTTGNYLWQTESEFYSDAYGWGNVEHTWYFAYGKLYSTGLGGIVYAYDLQTGNTAWTYVMDDAYNEPVTGQNWWGWITLIADGKIYVGTVEHSAEQPLPRGAPQICINATDGSEVWRVNGMFRDTRWGGNGIIADSIIATMDTYDQRVYAIGKGPTQTTITASPKVSMQGSSVLIEGTVTDTSPGTSRYDLTSRFPNGVAAVSDESMSQWMLYVYKQFECPTDAAGVPVTVDVVDANGNYRNIGTTTSDITGTYSFSWMPDIAGKYTVIVTFAGSKAYYPSYAQSAFVVDEAPDATAAPTTNTSSMADQYFLPLSIGMIVAIVVIGAILALLLLRKRP